MGQQEIVPKPSSPVNLPSLPSEILLEVISYLPTSSHIALKLCNKRLFTGIRDPPANWFAGATWCEKKAARRYIEERKEREHNRRRCILCNDTLKLYRFPSDHAPICKYHEARFMTTSRNDLEQRLAARVASLSSTVGKAFWVVVTRDYCVHNRVVVNWTSRFCGCQCRSCGHFPVQCYARVSAPPNKNGMPDVLEDPQYMELSAGGEYVVEEHWWTEDYKGKSLPSRLVTGSRDLRRKLTMLRLQGSQWEPSVCYYPSRGWKRWVLE